MRCACTFLITSFLSFFLHILYHTFAQVSRGFGKIFSSICTKFLRFFYLYLGKLHKFGGIARDRCSSVGEGKRSTASHLFFYLYYIKNKIKNQVKEAYASSTNFHNNFSPVSGCLPALFPLPFKHLEILPCGILKNRAAAH